MKGKVSKLNRVDFKPDQGIILWSFQLEGDGAFWRCGRDEPDIKEGQWIEFEHDGQNVNVSSIKQIDASGAAPTKAASPASTAAPVGDRIRYQAARRDAAQLVVAALHTDHLPHAANVAKAKRLDLLLGYVEQVTKELLAQEDKNA